jgi:phosphoglycerate-specific signal transduction histidine kinase
MNGGKIMSKNLFVQPEKRFLLFIVVNGVRDYVWCEDETDIKETLTHYRKQYGSSFCLEDGIEIGSCRDILMFD